MKLTLLVRGRIRPNPPLQVVGYDAPEVVVWAKEDIGKFDPTAKLVLYGGVVEASSANDMLWTQVMWVRSGVCLSDMYQWYSAINAVYMCLVGGEHPAMIRAVFSLCP